MMLGRNGCLIRSVARSLAAYALFVAMLTPSMAIASRVPPAEVPALVDGNVRYEVPHGGFGAPPNPCDQIGGCVVAYDNTTGTLLWSLRVYSIVYDPDLEEDVQWVFITSLCLANGRLLVTNERGQNFAIDPDTREVTDAASGCGTASGGDVNDTGRQDASAGAKLSSGCEMAPRRSSPLSLLAALAMFGIRATGRLVGLRRRTVGVTRP